MYSRAFVIILGLESLFVKHFFQKSRKEFCALKCYR